MLHGIHCIQSGCFGTCCRKSPALNRDDLGHAAKNPLHSIMLQLSTAFSRNTLGLAANNPQHSIMLQVSTAFNHAALNSLHSIGFHFFMLPGMHCIKSRCMESIAFYWDAFYQAAWNPLHSSMLHGIHYIQSGCMLPGCMYYTAFNDIAWNPLPSIGMLLALLH